VSSTGCENLLISVKTTSGSPSGADTVDGAADPAPGVAAVDAAVPPAVPLVPPGCAAVEVAGEVPDDSPELTATFDESLEQPAASVASRPTTQSETRPPLFIADLLSPVLPAQR
jgi:hypothetical protein